MRRGSAWFIAAFLLLLLSGGLGLLNGWREWAGARSGGRQLASLTEIGYGIAGPRWYGVELRRTAASWPE